MCPIIFTALVYFLATQNVQHLFKSWVELREREGKMKEEEESRISGEERDEWEGSGRLGPTGPSERGGRPPACPREQSRAPRRPSGLCYTFAGNKFWILLMVLSGADDGNQPEEREKD